MTLDLSRARSLRVAKDCWRAMRRLSRSIGGSGCQTQEARPFITPEAFQEELIALGLSGTKFDVEDYVAALSSFLGISVSVHVIPDVESPELTRRLALSGRLGEIRYSDQLGLAAVFLPESLPRLVSHLTVLHELGHLAAGDLLIEQDPLSVSDVDDLDKEACAGECLTARVRPGKRLASGLPFASEQNREYEANLRASYAFIAGCLGEESPYLHSLYEVL